MTTEERLDRLEKMVERNHHMVELMLNYCENVDSFMRKYLPLSFKMRNEIFGDLRGIRSFCQRQDTEMQEHFKAHLDKKKKSRYSI